MSLIGRDIANQVSGAAMASTGGGKHDVSPRFGARRRAQAFEMTVKHEERHDEDGAGNGAHGGEGARVGLRPRRESAGHEARRPAHPHDDGVAGRVRLMRARIEVVEAEREVERVQVLERRGEKRQVSCEDQQDQRSEKPRAPVVARHVRWDGGGALR